MTNRILRRPEVEKIVSLSRTTIYDRMAKGAFPKAIPIGGRRVGWLESDISEWIQTCVENANKDGKREIGKEANP